MAHAGLYEHKWVEIDNSVTSSDGQPSAFPAGSQWRTFDLYITGVSSIFNVDAGITQSSGPNAGLQLTNSQYFQKDFFGAPNSLPPGPGQLGADPLLEYDSYVGLGDLPSSSILMISPLSYDAGLFEGAWSPLAGSPAVAPNDDGEILLARFTVSSETGFNTDESATRSLTGSIFVFPEGAGSGVIVEISTNPFAIPSPGVAVPLALLLLAPRWRRD